MWHISLKKPRPLKFYFGYVIKKNSIYIYHVYSCFCLLNKFSLEFNFQELISAKSESTPVKVEEDFGSYQDGDQRGKAQVVQVKKLKHHAYVW